MEWTDTGFIMGTRRHGESSVIVEAFTPGHGRHLGLVRGGRGTRMRGVLQAGNVATFVWRARLAEHLGHFAVEPEDLRAAGLMADPLALAALNCINALVRLLPERDPHHELFARYADIVADLTGPGDWPRRLALFELALLRELGFGLDLDACAATGSRERLVYVSPKSGRAVSEAAGAPYRERLLELPGFLKEEGSAVEARMDAPMDALEAGFRLTGFFLARHVFEPRAIPLPEARAQMLRLLRQRATESESAG